MAVAELPSSLCPVLTKIMEAEAAAGILVPLVVMGMLVVELGLPVPAACIAPSTSQRLEFLFSSRQWCQCQRMATQETSAVRCHELTGDFGHHARGSHSTIYETFKTGTDPLVLSGDKLQLFGHCPFPRRGLALPPPPRLLTSPLWLLLPRPALLLVRCHASV